MVDVGEVRKGREPDEANKKTEEVGWDGAKKAKGVGRRQPELRDQTMRCLRLPGSALTRQQQPTEGLKSFRKRMQRQKVP
jgi:hypothetical protein